MSMFQIIACDFQLFSICIIDAKDAGLTRVSPLRRAPTMAQTRKLASLRVDLPGQDDDMAVVEQHGCADQSSKALRPSASMEYVSFHRRQRLETQTVEVEKMALPGAA